jgi:hypothetical protein
MRSWVFAIAVLALGAVAAIGGSVLMGQERAPLAGAASSDCLALTLPTGDHRHQLVLIDPRTRVAAVYQIDSNSGKIALKSVRNCSFDLQLLEYNGEDPLPREIRALLDQP